MKLIEVPIKVNVSLRKMIPNTITFLYGQQPIRYFRKYTLGNTSVYYVDDFDNVDLILTNRNRKIRDDEIDFACQQLFSEQPVATTKRFTKAEIEAARHHKIRTMKDIVVVQTPQSTVA